jgi:Tfp pilus assembly protein PilF
MSTERRGYVSADGGGTESSGISMVTPGSGGVGSEGWTPCAVEPENDQADESHYEVVRRGLRLAGEGHVRDAARYLKEALENDPENAAAWNNLGVLYQENGAGGPARDCYRQAVKRDAGLSTAWINLGWVYLGEGDTRSADGCLRRVVQDESENRAAWEGLAEVHRQSGEMEEAILCWRRAGLEGIDRRVAWIRSADILLDGQDAAGAVTCLRRALLDGEDAGIWARLGYAHSQLDEHSAAVRSYRRALEMEPGRMGLHYNLANVLLSMGRFQESRRHLEAAVRQSPDDAQAWNNLGHVVGELGNLERARWCFERSLEVDPCCHEAWNNLAGWHEENGDRDAAVTGYTRALELDGENNGYLLNRALVLATGGRETEARQDLESLCVRQPSLAAMLRELPAFKDLPEADEAEVLEG